MRSAAGLTSAVLAAIVALGLALALATAPARADGDPASDVLLAASVFYPYNPPVSPGLQARLDAEAAAAARARFPLKLALIAAPPDLGAIPELFDQPQRYADFLGQELGSQAGRPLLVVMPDGYGGRGLSAAAAAAAASLAKPVGSGSDDLARAAIASVPALAAAAGHPIAAGRSGVGGGAVGVVVGLLLGAVAAGGGLVALIRRRAPGLPADRGRARAGGGDGGRGVVQPRAAAALTLMLAAACWALARGLRFYGLSAAELGYDLDQPPLLLGLVGGWLILRSRGA